MLNGFIVVFEGIYFVLFIDIVEFDFGIYIVNGLEGIYFVDGIDLLLIDFVFEEVEDEELFDWFELFLSDVFFFIDREREELLLYEEGDEMN